MKMKLPQRKSSGKPTIFKVGRIVLWVVIVFVMIRGVITLIPREETQAMEVPEPPYVTSTAAQGFAEAFITDYLTYDPKGSEDYQAKMSFYFPESFRGVPLETASYGMPITVKRAEAISVNKIDDTHAYYTIRTVLDYSKTITNEKNEKVTEEKEIVRFLEVPISVTKDEQLYVYDFPSFVEEKGIEDAKVAELPELDKVNDEKIADEINSAVVDFFNSYATATNSQIGFLLKSKDVLQGYEGSIAFDKVTESYIYSLNGEDEAITDVVVYTSSKWIDSETEVGYNQRHRLVYTFDGEKWLITELIGGWPEWK